MNSEERGSLISRAISRMSRYSEIMGVLVRYGFAEQVRRVDLAVYRRLRRGGLRSIKARRTMSRAERMRGAIEELGPAFIKVGQLLSHRPDILPPDWIVEFGKLRSRVPPADSDGIRKVFIDETGMPPEDLFASFDATPLASASIAQVHRAVLKGGGTDSGDGDGFGAGAEGSGGGESGRGPEGSSGAEAGPGAEGSPGGTEPFSEGTVVAVKVQRPGIRRIIETDLAILRDIARLADRRIPSLAMFHPVEAVRELERAILSELDFRNEADNLKAFRHNFAADPHIRAPRPYPEMSGPRILIMEFLEGIPVGELISRGETGESPSADEAASAPPDRALLARRGAESVLRQVFEHRFFHSDPHGSNILVLPGDVLAFLDFGQVGTILPSQRTFLADLLAALIRSDAHRAVRAILTWSGYQDPDTARRLTADMELVVERCLSRPFGRIDAGETSAAVIDLIRRYGIDIPANFSLLGKALATIEDIASGLDPDYDFIRASRSFARRMIRRELSPERLAEQAAGIAGDTLRLLRDFPGDAGDLLRLLKEGKLRMELNFRDLHMLDATIKRVMTRLSAAVLLAAMIMGSSLLVHSLIPPLVFGIPAIGLLGFLFSGLVGVYLLIDLWRHR